MKKIIMMLGVFFLPFALFADDSQGISYLKQEYIITVPERDTALKAIIDRARVAKGVVLFYSSERVDFRIPSSEMEKIEASIKALGYIDDEKRQRADVGEEIATLKAQLKVKEDYIQKLYKLTAEANLGGTLNAEREIERATTESDQLKSGIKRLQRMARYSDVSVYVRGPSQSAGEKRSRWNFINSLGIERLTGEGQ
jgi:hypothetical protein